MYSFTAAGREYIDHEWLFQLVQFLTWSWFGAAGIALLKSALAALTLILAALAAIRAGVSRAAALGLAFLALAGGITRLIERPEIFSTLFCVVTFIVFDRLWEVDRERRPAVAFVLLPLMYVLWANIHAAVVVGLVIQALFIAGLFLERRRVEWAAVGLLAACAAAALLNPFGYRVFTVPFELTAIIDSGVLNNAEWRRPALLKTPFFFASLAISTVAFAVGRKHSRIPHLLTALLLAFIALRYTRNVALFCTFVPLTLAPVWPRGRRWSSSILVFGAAALGFVLTVYYPFQRGIGEASYFPDGIARFTRSAGLRGRMINSYDFGGYLIWKLYPERRVFIDGRNEVYLPLLERLAVARGDSRAWAAVLRDYSIDYALVQYVDQLDRVLTVGKDGRISESFASVSAARFPRSHWALVYWDDDGMVLVRRSGLNAALALSEFAYVQPEGRGYQKALVESGAVSRAGVVADLQRKLAEQPGSLRAQALISELQNR